MLNRAHRRFVCILEPSRSSVDLSPARVRCSSSTLRILHTAIVTIYVRLVLPDHRAEPGGGNARGGTENATLDIDDSRGHHDRHQCVHSVLRATLRGHAARGTAGGIWCRSI